MMSVISSIYQKIVENFRTLIFWPCFGLVFYLVEQINRNPWKCFEISCTWDAYIPFCEYFVIAYILWFFYMAGTIIYLIYRDPKAYELTMRFIIISFSVTILIYLLFPSVQLMRPYGIPRDNICWEMVRWFYRHDTPTNVCPSLHVIGTLATMYGALSSKRLMSHRGMRSIYIVAGSLICISTVFLKQHSLIDVFAGVGLCMGVWFFAMRSAKEDMELEEAKEVA
ncbi:MAG: phosphatase PAP2 family protein [Lachnospiraceae bacterium]|nr:phosphatase PAP2 family protein [Lachnospiraceae bacterium]